MSKKLIDKDTLVEEIKRLIDSNKSLKTIDPIYSEGLNDSLDEVLSFLNTLEVKEVKEVDLQDEIDKELDEEWYGEYINLEKFKRTAKHFFELGMRVGNKA